MSILNFHRSSAKSGISQIQSYVGGLAVQRMIEAIWPSFSTWHESSFPAVADITPAGLLSLSIFWIISLPFLYVSIPKLRWLFIAKMATMPFLWTALFTWALTAAGGFGPLLEIPTQPTNGMSKGYLFCYAITASVSGASSQCQARTRLFQMAQFFQLLQSTCQISRDMPMILVLQLPLKRWDYH